MSGRQTIRIVVGRSNDTEIHIDGIRQEDVSEFILRQKADGELATLILKRVLAPEPEQDDVVIEGLAEVVELFENKARDAAERQSIALASFMIHEGGDDPVLATLGDLVRDAKRYRALQRYLLGAKSLIALQTENRDTFVAGVAVELDSIADELRATDTQDNPEPDKST